MDQTVLLLLLLLLGCCRCCCGIFGTPVWVEGAAIHIVITDAKSGAQTLILLLISCCHLVRLCDRWTLWLLVFVFIWCPILLNQHLPEGGYLLLDLLFRVPLLLHHVFKLQALKFHLPLPFVVQDILVGLFYQRRLQFLQLFLRLIVCPVLLVSYR